MKKIISFILIILPYLNYAQDFKYSVHTSEVAFSGLGYINIVEDSLGTIYNAPHWQKTGLRTPIAYSAGSKMAVKADFEFFCSKAPDSIYIRGVGNDSISFPEKTVAIIYSSGKYIFTYDSTEADKIFPMNKVNYYAPFYIIWEFSFDKGKTWLTIDSTDHKIYVTKSAPMVQTTNFKYYHTVLELSCKNAIGQTTDSGVISKCWEEFTDHVVLNYKGDSLFYYQNFATSNTFLPQLLKYRNAQCYSFAQLFASMIKIQGISKTNNYVYITAKPTTSPCGGSVLGFLVNNWKFGIKSDSATCPLYPYRNNYSGAYISSAGYTFTTSDATDNVGIEGQCNKNPPSLFNNHMITKYDGIYYDACYGLSFNSIADFKAKAVGGWVVRVVPSSFNFTNDLSVCDLQESIATF